MIEWVQSKEKTGGNVRAVVDERNTTEETRQMGGDGRDLGRRYDLVTQ